MATLNLTKLWVNRLDTGAAVSAYSHDRSHGISTGGGTFTFGGGRRRSIIAVGQEEEFHFQMALVTIADLTTLQNWIGLTVQVRDTRGRLFVGAYYAVNDTELKDALTLYDVSIVLHGLTVPEGV